MSIAFVFMGFEPAIELNNNNNNNNNNKSVNFSLK